MYDFSNRLTYIYENINEGIVFQDPSGMITEVNNSACKIFNMNKESFKNFNFLDDRKNCVTRDLQTFSSKDLPFQKVIDQKTTILKNNIGILEKNFHTTWYNIDSYPIIEDGKIVSICSIFSLIETIENKFELLFNNLPMMIALVDENLTYRFVNDKYINYLPGFTKEKIEGRKVDEILSKKEFDKVSPLMKKALLGEVVRYSRKSVNTNRADIYLDGTLLPYYGKDKRQNGFILFTQDVTEKVNLLDKTKQQELHLIQQSKMAMVGEMIAAVAHQWKQPLNILSLYTQDLPDKVEFDGLTVEDAEKLSDEMMRQIKYMSETINDFRNFFKPSNEKKEFSLLEAIDSVQKLIGNQLLLHNINIEITGEDATVLGHYNDFKQVLINLIHNSKDAIIENNITKSIIKINISPEEDFTKLTIEDNGGGIPQDLLPEKIFDPYITTKGEKGTGIGLSLVKTIIERIDGTISVKNINDGAMFTIKLKRCKG